MSREQVPARPVVGHHSAWGLSPRPRIQPYQLTPGSTDTMAVRVREKIDIRGIGTDVVDMQGVFIVRRDHPCISVGSDKPVWGQSCLKTEFRSLELYGESPVFGTVRVHLAPDNASHGEVGPGENGSLAANCVAHCYPVIELPELGMSLTTSGQPIELASKVIQVPPVGDVARSSNSAALVDESGNAVGEIVSSDIEVGELLASIPLGKTGDNGNVPVHDHSQGQDSGDDAPSGPSFFTQPVDEGGDGQQQPSSSMAGMDMSGGSMAGMDMGAGAAGQGTDDATKQAIAQSLLKLEQQLAGLAREIRKMVSQ
jgi:hypothetical protein